MLLALGFAALARQHAGLSVKRAVLFVAVMVFYVLLDVNGVFDTVDNAVRLGCLIAMLTVAGLLSSSKQGSPSGQDSDLQLDKHVKTD